MSYTLGDEGGIYKPGGSALTIDQSEMMVCHGMNANRQSDNNIKISGDHKEGNSLQFKDSGDTSIENGPISGTLAVTGDGTDRYMEYDNIPPEIDNNNLPCDSGVNDGQMTIATVCQLPVQPEDGSGNQYALWAYEKGDSSESLKFVWIFDQDPWQIQFQGFNSTNGTNYLTRINAKSSTFNDGTYSTVVWRVLDTTDQTSSGHDLFIDGELYQTVGGKFTNSGSYLDTQTEPHFLANQDPIGLYWPGKCAFFCMDKRLWTLEECYQFNNYWDGL